LEQALEMLRRRGRVSYRALQVQFQLDDTLLEVLKDEIVEGHQLARDQEGKMLVWTGDTASPSVPVVAPTPDYGRAPLTYTPPYLAEKILTSRFDRVARAVAHGPMAWVLWLLGYPDQALTRSHAMLTYAQELQHALSLARALHDVMTLHKLRGEAHAAQEWAEAALAILTEQGFGLNIGSATFTQGWALAAQGRHEEGLAQMRQGLAARRAEGAGATLAEFPSRLGEAYGRIGQAEERLRLLVEALAVVDKDPWYEAEIHRIQGELLLQQLVPDAPQAAACFQQALTVAHRQQAKSWELRAAMSLSRLWQQQGKRAEARALLTPIYSWFTEGFDTSDLQEAKALLEDLEA
jgi:predicted ATPase